MHCLTTSEKIIQEFHNSEETTESEIDGMKQTLRILHKSIQKLHNSGIGCIQLFNLLIYLEYLGLLFVDLQY